MKTNQRNIRYKRSLKGVLTCIYNDQKKRCRLKGRPLPEYTLSELHKRFLKDPVFIKLHLLWTLSGHPKMMKPSIDRIDPTKGYSMGNIQIVTWRRNRKKADMEATVTKGRPVVGVNLKTGQRLFFGGMHEAERKTGCDARLIHKCCVGERRHTKGVSWAYDGQQAMRPGRSEAVEG